MSFFEVKSLSLILENKLLLDDISFSINEGTITLIAGANGSGKSLLLKTIKGLIKEKSGSILIEGKELKRKERLNEIGLVFQDTDLQIVGQTVKKDILFGAENINLDKKEREESLENLLTLFSLKYAENSNPSILSGGEKRKLSIASLLIMKPKLLLLDEPFANLDYPSVKTLIDALVKLKNNGVTILIVSHEAEKFLYYTDRTLILKKGKIIFNSESSSSLEELRKNDIYIPKNANFEDLRWI